MSGGEHVEFARSTGNNSSQTTALKARMAQARACGPLVPGVSLRHVHRAVRGEETAETQRRCWWSPVAQCQKLNPRSRPSCHNPPIQFRGPLADGLFRRRMTGRCPSGQGIMSSVNRVGGEPSSSIRFRPFTAVCATADLTCSFVFLEHAAGQPLCRGLQPANKL